MKTLFLLPMICLITYQCIAQTGNSPTPIVTATFVPKPKLDKHGCNVRDSYLWSALKGECVQLHKDAIRAPYAKHPGIAVFIITEPGSKKMELYLHYMKPYPVILKRKGDHQYSNKQYTVTDTNGYVVYDNGEVLAQSK